MGHKGQARVGGASSVQVPFALKLSGRSTRLIVQQFFRMTCKKVGKLARTVFLGAVPIV